jgi:starch synthase
LPDGLNIYFIDNPSFYGRAELYGRHTGDYPDNAKRFLFLCKSVVNLARYLPWQPEVLHVHDWHTALTAPLVFNERTRGGWTDSPPVCCTLHNLAYQGIFPAEEFALTNLPSDYFRPNGMEYYGKMNCLKAGIVYSDLITTVSRRYALEATTEQFGCGLDGVLSEKREVFVGIVNGVDYEEWTTESNPYLRYSFDSHNLRGKESIKRGLQEEMRLPARANVPLFGSIGRLAEQKGVDILLGSLEEMLSADMQFVLLGSGSRDFERAFRKLALRHPSKCAIKIGFDTGLSHRIEAGCDFFLMPSRFEPCGLNQMYSLRYGTIPIVRITGGLDDCVIDMVEDPENANGIKFAQYSIQAQSQAIRKALILYNEKELLDVMRQNGMAMDFSWKRTASEYLLYYRQLLSNVGKR